MKERRLVLLQKRRRFRTKVLLYLALFSLWFTALIELQAKPSYAYVSALGNVTNVSAVGDSVTFTVDNGTEPNDDIVVCKCSRTEF